MQNENHESTAKSALKVWLEIELAKKAVRMIPRLVVLAGGYYLYRKVKNNFKLKGAQAPVVK